MFQETDPQINSHKEHLKNCKKIYDQLHNPIKKGTLFRRSRLSEQKYYSQDLNNSPKLDKIHQKYSMPKINQRNKLDHTPTKIRESFRNKYKKKTPYTKMTDSYQERMLPNLDKNLESHKKNNFDNQFSSYLDFIDSQNRVYHLAFNFDKIFKIQSSQAWHHLDLMNCHVILLYLQKILQNITVIDQIICANTNKSENQKTVSAMLSVQHYCCLFFNNFEKVKTQIILREHCFTNFSFRIKPIFVLQRIAIYFLYIILDLQIFTHQVYRNRFQNIFQKLHYINKVIITIIQQNRKGNKVIGETFKILKSVSQVQKKLTEIQKQLSIIQQQTKSVQLGDVIKKIKPFLRDSQSLYSYQSLIKAEMIISWKYLHVPPTPFLPQISTQYIYTAIIDLHETIIHFDVATNILKYRPGMDNLFKQLNRRKFEVILFTTENRFNNFQNQAPSSVKYIDLIVSQIQSKGKIFDYKLYGEHLSIHNGRQIKDIRRLGRDLQKIIMIDDMNTNFGSCLQNGIEVSSWYGDKTDNQLYEISKVISEIPIAKQQLNQIDKVINKNSNKQQTTQVIDLRKLIKKHNYKLKQMLEKEDMKREQNNTKSQSIPQRLKSWNSSNQFLQHIHK